MTADGRRNDAVELPGRRLFFALWPDDGVRSALVRLQRGLLPARVRAVPGANLHLTLLFAGTCDAASETHLAQAAARLRPAPFELVLDRARLVRRGGIAWIGATSPPAPLLALAGGLREAASAAGLTVERRPFAAHVTLARRVEGSVGDAPGTIAWRPEAFGLYASELHPRGARYHCIARWPIGAD